MELIKFITLLIAFIIPLMEHTCSFRLNDRVKRLVNGTSDSTNMIKHEVYVRAHTNPPTICSGSIISDMFVLTAAHCVVYPNTNQIVEVMIEVRAGITSLADQNHVIRLAEKVYIPSMYYHHQSDPKLMIGDVALLRLNCKLELEKNSELQQLKLPSEETNEMNVNQYADNVYLFSGFGIHQVEYLGESTEGKPLYNKSYPSQLQYAYVNVSHTDDCNAIDDEYYHMCAIMQPNDLYETGGICSGDSGGAIFTSDYTAIGITSFSTEYCKDDEIFPTVYTRVSSFINFIHNAKEDKLVFTNADGSQSITALSYEEFPQYQELTTKYKDTYCDKY